LTSKGGNYHAGTRRLYHKYSGLAAPNQIAGQGLYPGACKFVGYNSFAGKAVGAGFGAKGVCLGLGLGLGAWGPLLLIGAGIAGGYFFFRDRTPAVKLDAEEKTPVEA